MLKLTEPQSKENPALPESRLKQSLNTAALIGLASVLLGLIVLAAWIFNVPVIKSIQPNWAAMKANTAIGFILAGAALCLIQRRNASAWVIPVAAVCALATTALGLVTLIQYFAQVDLGIDQVLFATADAEYLPGRPAQITAFNYTLIGAALLLLCTRVGALRTAAQMLAVPVLALSYVALLGYVLSASSLYQIPGFVSVAFHTAAGQLVLGLAVMASAPETGITRLLISSGQGSRLARRLVIISAVLFPLLGWLRVEAETLRLVTTEMGVALLISITLVIVLSFILLPIEALVRGEVERERLGAAVAASKRAENTFRNVLNAAPDGMLVVNRSGEIVMANAEVENLFGYTHYELLGQSVDILVPARHHHSHVNHRESFWRDPSTRPMGQGKKLSGRRRDGSEIPVEIALSPVNTEAGDLVISSIRDISERVRFFEALHDKNVELERAAKAKDHFLANMSHELRTPLTVIIGFIKILMMGSAGPLNDRQEQQASKIEANATHLLSLLNDLLDLAKVESGNEEISLEPVDLRSVMEEVETSLRPLAESKGLALEIDCPPQHNLGRSSRRTLLQILLNLANNGIKFTESGSMRIVVEAAPGGNRAITHVHVIDTGIGIRPEDHEKLFHPFTQLNPDANEAGTGLGLHLSRSLARSLGGDVIFRSRYGQGSTFTLILREASKAETRMAS
ncbi:MAG TPA: PAS domain-containing sensor histidine kinase [Methyloceanibacter sp.]|nr:PAS domain-containing sensor histidine kinase [Methyloceanibacter sp.]